MNETNLISNMSYTSRDFNTIYPELLDLVKKLTYKWDPSISNESDPGVILIKLNALIADKCNYNIDKNVLECFPLSVTQESNARQLYEQLGYHMKWYQSARTTVSLSWKDFTNYTKSSTSYVTIPRFVQVCDYDNTVSYVLTGPASGELNSASNARLYLDGNAIEFNAIQGAAVVYDINGETTIQASDLDTNNRLYFSDTDIAENGIFITNIDSENYASWIRKDNLATENLGNTFYSFGVLPGTNTCYIEFPQDASTIFRNGIGVVYIRTAGHDGNIASGILEKFNYDLGVTLHGDNDEEKNIALSIDNVEITNIVAGTGGEEKESLSEAYRNYQRTIGTFNTLITLRDYINAILNMPGYASNVIVTDRNNDIQCSYKIMTSNNNVSNLINKVDVHDNKTELNAFNLKLYILQYATATVDNAKDFNKTFQLLSNTELETVKSYIEDEKAIPHDFSDIRTPQQYTEYVVLDTQPKYWDTDISRYYYVGPTGDMVPVEPGTVFTSGVFYQKKTYFRSHFCLFKNVYPIDCRITPVRTLDKSEQDDLKNSIWTYLYEHLNSKELDFGQTITAYQLEKLVTESDVRISSTSIQNVNMKTYVTYWNGKEFINVDLSRFSGSANPQPYIYRYNNLRYSNVQAASTFLESIGSERCCGVYTFKLFKDARDINFWALSRLEDNNPATSFVKVDNIGAYIDSSTLPDERVIGDWVSIEINPVDKFRDEIYVKSVLQGVSPLFVQNTDFNFDVDQDNSTLYENVESVELGVNITIENDVDSNHYTLRDNESIRFCTSNLLDGSSFSNYVKYYFISPLENPTITSGSIRKLEQGEYLILFWKETDNNMDPYSYEVYGQGNIVNVSGFSLSIDASEAASSDFSVILDSVYNIGTEYAPRLFTSSKTFRMPDSTENSYMESVRNWLTGGANGKSIQIKYINSLRLDNSMDCYWILNNPTITTVQSDDDEYVTTSSYVLFDDFSNVPTYSSSATYNVGDRVLYNGNYYECIVYTNREEFNPDNWRMISATEYILDSGEYFFYKTSVAGVVNVLGAGTRIVRPDSWTTEWAVNVVSSEKVNNDASTSLRDSWQKIPSAYYIDITEQKYVTLGPGASIYFEFDSAEEESYIISSFTEVTLDDIANIKYTFNTLTEEQKKDINNYENSLENMSNIDVWRARSVLSLSLDKGSEQILLEGQNVQLNYADETTPTLIEGADFDAQTNSYPVVIQSLFELNTQSTSGEILAIQFDENGNPYYDTIYEYSKKLSTETPDKIIYAENGGASIFFPIVGDTSDYTISIDFSVPAMQGYGGYIVSLYNPYEDLTGANLFLTFNGETLYPIANETDYNLATPGTYFFKLPTSSGTLAVTLGNLIRSDIKIITLNKLYCYDKPEAISPSDFVRYEELIPQFDIDNQFQYVYDIPENVLIEDPLDPYSFLNPYHIYNKFTICQLDTTRTNSSYVISAR